jgi:hypothetical protein
VPGQIGAIQDKVAIWKRSSTNQTHPGLGSKHKELGTHETGCGCRDIFSFMPRMVMFRGKVLRVRCGFKVITLYHGPKKASNNDKIVTDTFKLILDISTLAQS